MKKSVTEEIKLTAEYKSSGVVAWVVTEALYRKIREDI